MPRELSPEEFRKIYEKEFSFVVHSLRLLGVQAAHLEDFTHDLFVVVFRRWATYDESRPLRPWLCGIAYRLVLDWNRKKGNRWTTTEERSLEATSGEPSPEERAERKEEWDLAAGILQKMELGRRSVFILHELEGVPMPAVAENLGIPLNTAYSRLRLARRDFNQATQQLEEEQS